MASATATAVAAKMAEIGGERGVDLVIRPLRRVRKEEGPPQVKGDHRSGFNGVGGEL